MIMNKFKKFFKSFCLLLMCTMCAFLCACGGVETEDDDYQFGLRMDNVKILRRSYGEDRASAVAMVSSYYDSYVNNLLKYFSYVYGIVNEAELTAMSVAATLNAQGLFDEETKEAITTLLTEVLASGDDFKYNYDAIRYQIYPETALYAPKWKKETSPGVFVYSNAATAPDANYVENEEKFTTAPIAMSPTHYRVTADMSKGWNWGLYYELGTTVLDKADAFLKAYPGSVVSGNTIVVDVKVDDYTYSNAAAYNGLSGYYGTGNLYSYLEEYNYMSFDSETYTNSIFTPIVGTAVPATTNFEKALTYVIYSIVNNQKPANITVTKTNTGNTFTVEGYSNLDAALTSARQEYIDKTAYIGLTKTDQETLVKYILDNVIGVDAVEYANSVDATSRYDLHYEEMVSAIVTYCTALTPTGETKDADGNSTGEITYIGGQYLSSDIVDYAYASAYVNGDALGFLEFAHLGEYEYQSMMLMPKEDAKIDEIWLDFAYDGNGGTNDSIKIRTYIRNYVGNGEFVIYTKDIEVKEGVIDVGEDGTTLCFDFSDTNDKYIQCDKIDFDEAIHSDRYKKRVEAGGIINPLILLEKRELVISNMTNARNYYSLIEGEYRDYGVFNHNMLSEEVYNNGHYVEIAFEVISATTDNFKFYCGLSLVNEYFEKDLSQYQ